MRPTSQQIVAALEEALGRANAPICYIHRTGKQAPFAAVISSHHLEKLSAAIPPSENATDLFMNHGHVEGDEDEEATWWDWKHTIIVFGSGEHPDIDALTRTDEIARISLDGDRVISRYAAAEEDDD